MNTSTLIWLGVPVLDLSPLLVHRHADDVADVGRRLLGRAEVEVLQDLADRERVGDVGHRLERPLTATADEQIHLKHLGNERRGQPSESPGTERRRRSHQYLIRIALVPGMVKVTWPLLSTGLPTITSRCVASYCHIVPVPLVIKAERLASTVYEVFAALLVTRR